MMSGSPSASLTTCSRSGFWLVLLENYLRYEEDLANWTLEWSFGSSPVNGFLIGSTSINFYEGICV